MRRLKLTLPLEIDKIKQLDAINDVLSRQTIHSDGVERLVGRQEVFTPDDIAQQPSEEGWRKLIFAKSAQEYDDGNASAYTICNMLQARVEAISKTYGLDNNTKQLVAIGEINDLLRSAELTTQGVAKFAAAAKYMGTNEFAWSPDVDRIGRLVSWYENRVRQYTREQSFSLKYLFLPPKERLRRQVYSRGCAFETDKVVRARTNSLQRLYQTVMPRGSRKMIERALRDPNVDVSTVVRVAKHCEKVAYKRYVITRAIPRLAFHFLGGFLLEAASVAKSAALDRPARPPLTRFFEKLETRAKCSAADKMVRGIGPNSGNVAKVDAIQKAMFAGWKSEEATMYLSGIQNAELNASLARQGLLDMVRPKGQLGR